MSRPMRSRVPGVRRLGVVVLFTLVAWQLPATSAQDATPDNGRMTIDLKLKNREAFNSDRLMRSAAAFAREGKSKEAIRVAKQALDIVEDQYKGDNIRVLPPMVFLADLHTDNRNYEEAESLLLRALALGERLGARHHDVAKELIVVHLELGELYQARGELERAETPLTSALAIATSFGAEQRRELVFVLVSLGKLYEAKREYQRSEPFLLRALETAESAWGPEDLYVDLSLCALAACYRASGERRRSVSYYERSLALRERRQGSTHSRVADTLNLLGLLHLELGEGAKAEPLLVRSLGIREARHGREHPAVAESIGNLALLAQSRGDYVQAEQLFLRALVIGEKALGREHPDVASALNNLAAFYADQGRYASSEPLFVRALAIREKALGPAHSAVAGSLNNLAVLSQTLGEYSRAAQLHSRALEILVTALGAEHPDVAASLDNLALLNRTQRDYAKAESLSRRALAIREKALGPGHLDVATTLSNLAEILREAGRTVEAEQLHQRSLTIRGNLFGAEHPSAAASLNNLAILHQIRGESVKAELLYRRALRIFETSLGPEHPDVARVVGNLALLCLEAGRIDEAIELQRRSADIFERDRQHNLLGGSHETKLGYLAMSGQETDLVLSLHLRQAPSNPRACRLALETIVRRKGRALDMMTRQVETLRLHARPEDRTLLDQLSRAESELSRRSLAGPGQEEVQSHRARLDALSVEVETLEREVSQRSLQFAATLQRVALDAVRPRIPEGAMLVEFAVYCPYDASERRFGQPRYAVYVAGPLGEIAFADLGETAPIDEAIGRFRTALQMPKSDPDTELKPVARRLHELVMAPVCKLTGASRRLLVAPDGLLNLVPLAALVDEHGRYLVEGWDIQYVTSGRDLLRLGGQTTGSRPVVLANPDYGTEPAGGDRDIDHASAATSAGDLSGVVFSPLPGTGEEAAMLARLMPDSKVLERGEATEAALKQIKSPAILHVATHGYFLDDGVPRRPRGEPGRAIVAEGPPILASSQVLAPRIVEASAAQIADPLLRSGLALAGANRRASGEGEDGLLTAREAAGLDLWGTKIVVLSACNTGVGEVKSSDGVYGLRRALVLAGAETTMVSLWPVSDTGTRDLMIAFYRQLSDGAGRGEALRRSQLEMLSREDRRHPYFWACFIQSGDWTPLGR